MEINNNYGILLKGDAKIYRKYFEEMCKLIGINIKYRAVKPDKHWTTYAEIKSNYEEPITVGCIFEQYPDQKTMKKIGWVNELDTQAPIIHIAFDTPGLQVGCLVEIPGALNTNEFKLYRITKLSTAMIYPSAIICQIVPEYETIIPESDITDFRNRSMTIMRRDEDDK